MSKTISIFIAMCALCAACSSGGDSTSTPELPATTRVALSTSIPGDAEDGVCNWFSGKFDINPGVTCEEAEAAGLAVLKTFPAQADSNQAAVQLLVTRVCTGAVAEMPMTYLTDDLHIPALAEALVGPICPGDPANIVPES